MIRETDLIPLSSGIHHKIWKAEQLKQISYKKQSKHSVGSLSEFATTNIQTPVSFFANRSLFFSRY